MIGNTETKQYEFINSEDGSIDFDKVQELMLRTMNNDLSDRDYLGNAVLGLCGELGEINQLVDEISYHYDYSDDEVLINSLRHRLKLEIGDLCWYHMLLCRIVGIEPKTGFTFERDSKSAQKRLTRQVLEIADIVKKYLYHGRAELDIDIFVIAQLAKTIRDFAGEGSFELDEIFQSNIDKLAKRHKGGKFSPVLQDAKLDEVQGNE